MAKFVAPPVLTLALGVVGHRAGRKLPEPERIARQLDRVFGAADALCASEVEAAAGVYAAPKEPAARPYRIRLLTGFAEGSDQIAASVAPPHWEVEAILAGTVAECELTFAPQASSDGTDRRAAFREALTRAQGRVVELPQVRAGASCRAAAVTEAEAATARQKSYARQATFLRKQVDVLVAVWDGEPTAARGETGDTVMDALKNGVPVIWICSLRDRPPWLLTNPDDVERETEAPDALDGPLQDALAIVLRPPGGTGDVAEGARAAQRLRNFLNEENRLRCGWVAYAWLTNGWAVWRWRLSVALDQLPTTQESWGRFAQRASDGTLSARVRDILLPRFHAADQIAAYHAHVYRSVYVLTYLLAALAVFVTSVSLTVPHPESHTALLAIKTLFVAVEFSAVLVILALVRKGRDKDWHGRWMEARGLAERLRHLRILAPVGECDVARDVQNVSSAGALWTSWYLRATIRELGLPFGALDPAYLRKTLLAARQFELKEQLTFNETRAHSLDHLDHALHRAGAVSFIATATGLGIYLVALAIYLAIAARGGDAAEFGALLVQAIPFVALLASFLPALGAAIAGVRTTGDFEGFAERARETAGRLRALQPTYERAEREDEFELTADTIAKTARVLGEDVSVWRAQYARKKLALPS